MRAYKRFRKSELAACVIRIYFPIFFSTLFQFDPLPGAL